MKIDLKCRDVTKLVLEGEDRKLTTAERIGIRLHLAICSTCPTFVRQVQLMRDALDRWKSGGER
jgi:hypothetical protein